MARRNQSGLTRGQRADALRQTERALTESRRQRETDATNTNQNSSRARRSGVDPASRPIVTPSPVPRANPARSAPRVVRRSRPRQGEGPVDRRAATTPSGPQPRAAPTPSPRDMGTRVPSPARVPTPSPARPGAKTPTVSASSSKSPLLQAIEAVATGISSFQDRITGVDSRGRSIHPTPRPTTRPTTRPTPNQGRRRR